MHQQQENKSIKSNGSRNGHKSMKIISTKILNQMGTTYFKNNPQYIFIPP